MTAWAFREFLEILLVICMPLQIRISRNFRGYLHVPADGVAGHLGTRARRPGITIVVRRQNNIFFIATETCGASPRAPEAAGDAMRRRRTQPLAHTLSPFSRACHVADGRPEARAQSGERAGAPPSVRLRGRICDSERERPCK